MLVKRLKAGQTLIVTDEAGRRLRVRLEQTQTMLLDVPEGWRVETAEPRNKSDAARRQPRE